MIVRESTAGINVDTVENLCWNSFKCSAFIFNNISIFLVTLVYLSSFSGIRKKCWWHFNRRDYVWLTLCLFICCAVMNNPELPLDPNLQTSNLLITFLKYASIVMQDTKGKEQPSCPLPLCSVTPPSFASSFFHFCFSITHLKCPQQWQIFFFLFNLANHTKFYNINWFQSLLKHQREKLTPRLLIFVFLRWAST